MNYMKYYDIDVVNGPGTRCTLFVCGCEHQCEGCYNKSTWSPEAGNLFDNHCEDQIIADLQDTRIYRRGLSISGGDPLYPANVDTILHLVQRVNKECPTKDIWVWTGYTYEELSEEQKKILPYITVLIDGKYDQEFKDRKLKYRGSYNQKVIDVPRSLEKGGVVLYG